MSKDKKVKDVKQEVEKSLEEYKSYGEKLHELIEETYRAPKQAGDIDVFLTLKKYFNDAKEGAGEKFEEIVLNRDPNVPYLHSNAQRLIIAHALLNYYYKLASERDDLDVSRIAVNIPFSLENDKFLAHMKYITIPMLVNAELI